MSKPESLDATIPNAKRKRTESNDEAGADAESVVKRSSFWFEDGNVILQAENFQFRVHKGILSRHSTFFRDMFSLPQPAEKETLPEGCPVVPVTDDPRDWGNLLVVLYDGVIAQMYVSAFSLTVLGSMLRLGRKYQFNEIRDAARDRIKMEIPNALKSWEEKYQTGNKAVSYVHCEEFELLNILLEVQLQTLLPVAFYLCLQNQNLNTVFHGLERGNEPNVQLAYESKVNLVLGEQKLRAAIIDHSLGWLAVRNGPIVGQCSSATSCLKSRQDLYTRILKGPPISMALSPPINGRPDQYYEKCFAIIQANHDAGRKRIWSDLPSYFGLPKWEELKDF